jgi:hypothetical protein
MANLNLPPALESLSAIETYKDTKVDYQVWWCNAYLDNNYISKDINTLPYCQTVDTKISTVVTTYNGSNIGKLLQVSGKCSGYRSIYENSNYTPTHVNVGDIAYATDVTGKNSIKYWITKEYNDRLLNKIYANNTDFTDYQLTNYLPTANYKAKEMNHNVIEDTLGLLSVINNAKINGNLDIRNITLNNVSAITTNNVSTKGTLRLATDDNFKKFSDMSASRLSTDDGKALVTGTLSSKLLNTILTDKLTELDTGSIIAADDVNTIYKVLIPLANDCICYSNCNSYYVCVCYGNCGCNY